MRLPGPSADAASATKARPTASISASGADARRILDAHGAGAEARAPGCVRAAGARRPARIARARVVRVGARAHAHGRQIVRAVDAGREAEDEDCRDAADEVPHGLLLAWIVPTVQQPACRKSVRSSG